MSGRIYTPEDLERLAITGLDHFGGGYPDSYDGGGYPDSYDGGLLAYVGDDDALLSFEGSNSFVDNSEKRVFTLNLQNTTAFDDTVYLTPGLGTKAGTIADGAFNGIGGRAFNGSSGDSDKTVAMFLDYLYHNPTQVGQVSVKSTNTLQIGNQILMAEEVPWSGTRPERSFDISAGQDQYVNQTTVVVVNTPGLIFGKLFRNRYQVLANTTVTLKFYLGASASQGAYLQKRMDLAAKGGAALPGGVMRKPYVLGR